MSHHECSYCKMKNMVPKKKQTNRQTHTSHTFQSLELMKKPNLTEQLVLVFSQVWLVKWSHLSTCRATSLEHKNLFNIIFHPFYFYLSNAFKHFTHPFPYFSQYFQAAFNVSNSIPTFGIHGLIVLTKIVHHPVRGEKAKQRKKKSTS